MQLMLLTLLDGTTVFVRPISPEDKPLLAEGLRQLSPETAFRRFLSPKVSFSAAELRYLTEVDQRDHIAYVALQGEHARRGRPLRAHATTTPPTWRSSSATRGRASGSAASWSALLAERAREQGVTQIAGTMLAGNARGAAAHARLRHARGPRRDVARRARSRHTSGRLTLALKRAAARARCVR